jgi:hypothetical protein
VLLPNRFDAFFAWLKVIRVVFVETHGGAFGRWIETRLKSPHR